jgi:hypothetical protein
VQLPPVHLYAVVALPDDESAPHRSRRPMGGEGCDGQCNEECHAAEHKAYRTLPLCDGSNAVTWRNKFKPTQYSVQSETPIHGGGKNPVGTIEVNQSISRELWLYGVMCWRPPLM